MFQRIFSGRILILVVECFTLCLSLKSNLRLNQVQIKGTHNSFHVANSDFDIRKLQGFLRVVDSFGFPSPAPPESVLENRYTYPPLAYQLHNQKVRSFEFDVFADTKGGIYNRTFSWETEPKKVTPTAVTLTAEALKKPGFKVFHLIDFDTNSICLTLKDCLSEIKTFSESNPNHFPIIIHLQLRDSQILNEKSKEILANLAGLESTSPEKITKDSLQDLENELLSVFGEEKIYSPKELIGYKENVVEALTQPDGNGWPLIDDIRGKVMFVIFAERLGLRKEYIENLHHNISTSMLCFLGDYVENMDNNTAFITSDKPYNITELSKTYMVRTLADQSLIEPSQNGKQGNFSRQESAISSGAQIIGSDFCTPFSPHQPQYLETNYTFKFSTRCNPLFVANLSIGNGTTPDTTTTLPTLDLSLTSLACTEDGLLDFQFVDQWDLVKNYPKAQSLAESEKYINNVNMDQLRVIFYGLERRPIVFFFFVVFAIIILIGVALCLKRVIVCCCCGSGSHQRNSSNDVDRLLESDSDDDDEDHSDDVFLNNEVL